ncbi:MAG: iron ABC transporter substrate-binding protein [Rhodospirillum sp.]|nr:iron ABC transporter substrate-binding protein [Rhodospirillum sp.]
MRVRRWFDDPQRDGLIAAAQKEGQLTVIGLPRDWCGCGALIDAFKAKYGLIVTESKPDATSAGQLEALKASRYDRMLPAPDVIDVGLSFGSAAKKDGLLQPYKVSTWSTISDAAKDPDGFWCGHYYGVLSLEINTDIVKNAPQDWSDLLRPEYRNAVALSGDPLTANQAILAVYAAGLSACGNRDHAAGEGLKFFAELSERGNLVPFVGTSQSLLSGSTPILIRWSYLALGDRDRFAGSSKIEVEVPKTGLVGGIYVEGISATAAHPNAAKLWMEHLYSDESQVTWLKAHCHPIRFSNLVQTRKVPVELLEQLPEIHEAPDELVFPTVEEQERAKEIIIKGWDDIVGAKIRCTPPVGSRPPTSLNDMPHRPSALG